MAWRRCDDEDDVELLGAPSARPPARWQKVVTQLSNPFVPPSLPPLSLLPPPPPMLLLSGHPSEASGNDNVAFGIPTDLETSCSSESSARMRGGRKPFHLPCIFAFHLLAGYAARPMGSVFFNFLFLFAKGYNLGQIDR